MRQRGSVFAKLHECCYTHLTTDICSPWTSDARCDHVRRAMVRDIGAGYFLCAASPTWLLLQYASGTVLIGDSVRIHKGSRCGRVFFPEFLELLLCQR